MVFSIEFLLFTFLPAVLWLYWPVLNSTLERVEFQVGKEEKLVIVKTGEILRMPIKFYEMHTKKY